MKIGTQQCHENAVRHVHNSWNELWGCVNAAPGRGYKEVMSQDGMYTVHVEMVAFARLKCYSFNYVITKRGKPDTTYGSVCNCLRNLFNLFIFISTV
jgi:hypothetical protein